MGVGTDRRKFYGAYDGSEAAFLSQAAAAGINAAKVLSLGMKWKAVFFGTQTCTTTASTQPIGALAIPIPANQLPSFIDIEVMLPWVQGGASSPGSYVCNILEDGLVIGQCLKSLAANAFDVLKFEKPAYPTVAGVGHTYGVSIVPTANTVIVYGQSTVGAVVSPTLTVRGSA